MEPDEARVLAVEERLSPTIITAEIPIRYIAFENPGRIIKANDLAGAGAGQEVLAVHTAKYTLTVSRWQTTKWLYDTYYATTGKGARLLSFSYAELETKFMEDLEKLRMGGTDESPDKLEVQ